MAYALLKSLYGMFLPSNTLFSLYKLADILKIFTDVTSYGQHFISNNTSSQCQGSLECSSTCTLV